MASHRKPSLWARWSRRSRETTPRHCRTVEVVDADDLLAHLLTPDALAAGRLPQGRYVAQCSAEVLPAALVEPGNGYCRFCVPVPGQRSGRSR